MSDGASTHEVSASYDNMAAVARGYTYGLPCILCSCGWIGHGENWEEVGSVYDEHLSEEGVRP